jgi:hypothetical protein
MPDESTTDQTCPAPPAEGKRLGKRPARGDSRTLNFARFVDVAKVPAKYDPWKKRAKFPARSFQNTSIGDCTRASQAVMAMRLERVETRRTPQIDDAEVSRVYFAMTDRLYGGGDTGAYELDALSEWRKPELTFRDTAGHPLTIDAFTKVNHSDQEEVRAAIAVSGKFGIKICLNLPRAFQRIDPPTPWDIPEGQPLTGDWQPGTWGGHSMFAASYSKDGVVVPHTWFDGPEAVTQLLTWRAFAAYVDEAYWVIDSLDSFRKRTPEKLAAGVDLAGIVKAVNRTSSHKITAEKGQPYQRGA